MIYSLDAMLMRMQLYKKRNSAELLKKNTKKLNEKISNSPKIMLSSKNKSKRVDAYSAHSFLICLEEKCHQSLS